MIGSSYFKYTLEYRNFWSNDWLIVLKPWKQTFARLKCHGSIPELSYSPNLKGLGTKLTRATGKPGNGKQDWNRNGNLRKKLHVAWAETRRLLVKILFTKLSRDDLGLMTILYTIKGAWTLSFIYNSVLWTLSWIHMPTLTKHWYCNCSSLTSPMTLGDPNPTHTRQIPAVKVESLLGETFMEDTLMQ